ncbi:MAG: DNA topoisomerase 4 subunit A [Prevotella sp.]|nr:DNA topoisomerase 4 subunit A [Prevotella sp.]
MGEFDDLIDDENSVSFDQQPATSGTESTNNTSDSGAPVNPPASIDSTEPTVAIDITDTGSDEISNDTAEMADDTAITNEVVATEPDDSSVKQEVVEPDASIENLEANQPWKEPATPPAPIPNPVVEPSVEPVNDVVVEVTEEAAELANETMATQETVASAPEPVVEQNVVEQEIVESAIVTEVVDEPVVVVPPNATEAAVEPAEPAPTVTVDETTAVTLDAVPDEVSQVVATAGHAKIANIDDVVKLSEADLAAEAAAARQAAIMKPIIEREERRQKLLAEKESRKTAVATTANNMRPEPDNVQNHDGNDSDDGNGEDGIIEKSVATIMHESMIPYSEFVILDRALPRVEDGLKPVQRRILYAMNDLGLMPDKPFRKSAAIVGECLGKYHPHGDTSVYDAMVRLAQPFNMNMPLIAGQGNFGSDDGDPPAAMRYTEAKLAPLALEMLRDMDKDTVTYSLTYDDRNTEPDTLPARYPNLLTNGSSGIAVGLATNIPPHNLGELIDAHIAFIDNPKITLKQILKIIKGPDFPTAGWIVADDNMIQAYETGRGKVVMSGRVHIEVEGDKRNIVITELPYQVNKVQLQKNIADLRENKKGDLQNITEIRDESDRNGMRILIKLRKDTDAHKIVEQLYKYTQLRCNFNYNMVAIAEGKPRQMGLLQIIEYYVNYQRQVIYKRSVFELNQAKERAHILEGLLVAIKNIDEVIKIIKTSKHTSEARDRLQKRFNLSERQAQAILDLRLARLTNLEVLKVEQELAELRELIDRLTAIIGSKKLQFEVVKTELLAIKKRFKVDRRTRVVSKLEDVAVTADDDELPVEDIVLTITAAGNIQRLAKKHFNMSNTAAFDGMREQDVHTIAVLTQTDKLLHIFTNLGKCYKLYGGDVPECRLKDRGIALRTLFPTALPQEFPVAIYPAVADTLPEYDLVWLSKTGMIKRSKFNDACSVIKSVFDVYKIREDRNDEILAVQRLPKNRTILMITNVGNVLNAATGDVPVQGRIASGVKGMQMDDSAWLAGIATADNTGYAVLVTNLGNAKKVAMKEIDKMVRYRKGLTIATSMGKGEEVIYATFARSGDDLVVKTANGALLTRSVDKLPSATRVGKMKNVFGKQQIVKGWLHRTSFATPEY